MSYQTEGAGRLLRISGCGIAPKRGRRSNFVRAIVARHRQRVMELVVNLHGGCAGWPLCWDSAGDDIHFTQEKPLKFISTPNLIAHFVCADDKGRFYVIVMPEGKKIYANQSGNL